MKKLIAGMVSAVIMMTATPSFSATKQEKLINELIHKSGATEQIKQLPEVIRMFTKFQLAIYDTEMNEKMSKVIEKISKEYFVGDDILKKVTETLKKDFNQEYAEKYAEWLNGKLGKKITKSEIRASSPEAALAVMAYAIQMEQNPPGEQRMALIERMIKALNVEKHLGEKTNVIFIKMIMGMNKTLKPEKMIPEKMLNEIKEIYAKSSVNQTTSFLAPSFLFTYDSLKDDELKEYVDFLETKEAQWFNDLMFQSEIDAIENDAEKFGLEIGKEIANTEPTEKEKLKWAEYKSKEGAFSIDFPGEPEFQKKEIPTEGNPLIMNMVLIQKNSMGFIVSWVNEYPPFMDKETDVKEVLTNASMGSAENTNGAIVESKFIDYKGYTGIEYKVALMGGLGLIKSRTYAIGNKLYQTMISGSIADVLAEENNRFFDSFNAK